MAERIASIILLVEDLDHENLLRRYLRKLGHDNRQMRSVRTPSGCGSGEQFVRQSYASEVRSIRSQMARTKACLLAIIDADVGSTDDRRRQLERALQDADEPPRSSTEPILNLVPKRNVETWILCLNSIPVNEADDYHNDPRVNAASVRQAATTLYEWTRPNFSLPASCVTSLRDCQTEFRRIPGDQ